MNADRISSSADASVGYRWLLTGVHTVDGDFDITQLRSGPWIDLRRDGRIVCVDGTNALSGTYVLTETGFTTHIRTSTAAAYVGAEPVRLATIAAFSALTSNGVSVLANLSDQHLALVVPAYELTFGSPEHLPDR